MPQMLSCTGLQELALEAQDIFAALKAGELTELDLPADFKPAVGLMQFAVSLRQTAQELGKSITITTQDPALLGTAAACGLDGVITAATPEPTGGPDVQ